MGSRKHNPEKPAWRGRSHKKGGEPVVVLRAEQVELPEEVGGEPFDYEAAILAEQDERFQD